jgi:hypothetical protein
MPNPENPGAQFLHESGRIDHTSDKVEHEQQRKKRKGEKIADKPAEKIADFLNVIERTHIGHPDDPRVLERIKRSYHKEHVLGLEDYERVEAGGKVEYEPVLDLDAIPESYWKSQIKTAVNEGREGDLQRAGLEFEKSYDEDGELEIELKHLPEQWKREAAETIISDQVERLDDWLNYLTSEDADIYPIWSKYWAFKGVTKLGKYNKEKGEFEERSQNTAAPVPELNAQALAGAISDMQDRYGEEYLEVRAEMESVRNKYEQEINRLENEIDDLDGYARLLDKDPEELEGLPEVARKNIKNNLEKYEEQFPNVNDEDGVAEAIHSREDGIEELEADMEEALSSLEKEGEEVLGVEAWDEDQKHALSTGNFAELYAKNLKETLASKEVVWENTDGEWKKYDSVEDAKELKASLKEWNTGWCTARGDFAENQLKGGDFYVYYSEDERGEAVAPRIAIRMAAGEIEEVRGIAAGQNMDEDIQDTDILEKKLDEFDGAGEKWKKKNEHMNKLTDLARRVHGEEGSVSDDDLKFLFEADEQIESFGRRADPRIEELREEVVEQNMRPPETLIDVGGGEYVAEHLDKFDGLNLNARLAEKLFEAGEGFAVADNLDKFDGLKLNARLAKKLFDAEQGWAVARHLDKFDGLNLNTRRLVKKLFDAEQGWAVAENLDKFEGLDHLEIAEKFFDAGRWGRESLAGWLGNFEGLDHMEIANKLIDEGGGSAVARNLDKFKGLNQDIAQRLIEHGRVHEVKANLSSFEGVDEAWVNNQVE